MSDVVIRAEGLGKKYLIGHQSERRAGGTLRDMLTDTTRGLLRSARDMAAGRQLVAGDEVEEFWALKDINFEIKRGEVVGIIGRNGAGKSTLLKVLSRITEPTEGRVEIKGRVASLLEVGTGFHPELTGRENIYLNGAILGMSREEIRRKFDEIVDFSGVEKFLDTPVKRYSSGMYVRLAFAVAAHLEPEILIVDEVLAVGDAEFQKKSLGKMQDVAGEGRTVIFVSHNLRSISQLCGRVFILSRGHIVADAPPANAISRYLSDGSESRGSVDIALDPPSSERGSREIAFRKFEIVNASADVVSRIGFGEPFLLRITVVSSIQLNGVLVGFSFITADGHEIQGTALHDGGIDPDFSPGTFTFECHISPMILVPGRYFIRAAIFKADHSYHHIDEVLQFEVDESPYRSDAVPSSHFVGDVYVHYKWRQASFASQ